MSSFAESVSATAKARTPSGTTLICVTRKSRIYSKAERFDWRVKDSEKRTVGISDRLAERLKARHKRHPGDGLVFPNSCDKPDKHLLRIIKRVALRAGLNCGQCMGTHNRKRVSCRTHPVCHKWLVQTFSKDMGDIPSGGRGLLYQRSAVIWVIVVWTQRGCISQAGIGVTRHGGRRSTLRTHCLHHHVLKIRRG